VEVARSGGASDEVRVEAEEFLSKVKEKTAQAEKNQRLLTALLDVSEPREMHVYRKDKSGRVMVLAQPTSDEQFAAAFRRWGVDVERDPAEQVVAQLAQQPAPVVQEIVAGLDEWSLVRRREQRPEVEWRRVSDVADRLDGDPRRRELRHVRQSSGLAQGREAGRLRELAGQMDPANEPVLGMVTLARALELAGDTPGAERVFRAALAARPGEVVLLDALGDLLERQQPPRLGEAIEYYRTARGLRPQLGAALGDALLKAGRAPEGEAIFRDLARRQSDNPEVPLHLGLALCEQKQLGEAVAAFRKAIALKPDCAEAYICLGLALYGQKKPAEAVAALRKAIALKPDDAYAYDLLGITLREQKQLGEAVAALRKAIALKPGDAYAYIDLGIALCEQKQLGEAVAAFRKAIALKPGDADAYIDLGNALREQKQLGEAVAAFRKAIALKPDDAGAHIGLGLALRDQKQLGEAVAALRKAIALKPGDADAYIGLGIALCDQKQLDEAVAAFHKAIALKPDDAGAYIDLGNALGEQKQLGEAVAAFRKAIALKPDDARAYIDLGIALCEQKQLGEAVAAFRKAIALKPDDARAYIGLGLALGEQKQLGEAVAAFRKADKLLPGNPIIQRNLRQSERWLQLDKRLPAILAGKEQPGSPTERLEFAALCRIYKRWYLTATRFSDHAFAAEPKLADDLGAEDRYNAACTAALAAACQGEDARGIGVEEWAWLQQHALDWLRADLTAYAKLVAKGDKESRQFVQQSLVQWQEDANLIAVRDKEWLDAMPAPDRERWRKLWADVKALQQQAAEKK
jgi:tetratricopeptide (TPR) repeat protein